MKLYDYLLQIENGEEVTVWDKEYDIETYFYNDFDMDDSWDKSMSELSKLLTVEEIRPRGVVVNISEIIKEQIDDLKKAELFYKTDIDVIMYDMNSILSGNVSEKWMEKFINALKG